MIAPFLLDPWVWVGAGAALMLAELALPGYLMLGFGLAALAMAALALALPATLADTPQAALWLLLAWALLALAIWWALSRRFGRAARAARGEKDVNDFRNR
jgi:membrane protein implicated in regulation of membrane protease activity